MDWNLWCYALGALGMLWQRRVARLRRLMLAFVLLSVWPALTASAPLAQPCTEASAAYLVRRVVEQTIISNGQPLTIPAGVAVGWSCASAADAEAAWQQAAAQIGR